MLNTENIKSESETTPLYLRCLLLQPLPIALDPSDRIAPSVLQLTLNFGRAVLVVVSHAFLASHGVAPILKHLGFINRSPALATEQRQLLIVGSHYAPDGALCVRLRTEHRLRS
jgi:hypothetical protein